jgi:hypothetical protein
MSADDFVWSCARCELQVFQDGITNKIIGDALSEDCSWPSCLQHSSWERSRAGPTLSDVVGTGSFLPDQWNDTYATADIVDYDDKPSVKVGREFLLRHRQADPGRKS